MNSQRLLCSQKDGMIRSYLNVIKVSNTLILDETTSALYYKNLTWRLYVKRRLDRQ